MNKTGQAEDIRWNKIEDFKTDIALTLRSYSEDDLIEEVDLINIAIEYLKGIT